MKIVAMCLALCFAVWPVAAAELEAVAGQGVLLGWVAIAAAVIGAYSSYDSSKRNEKAAESASGPQPYWSESEQGPPDWLLPYIEDTLPRAADQYQNNLNNPRVPPTFYDVTAGRHQTPLPTGVYGGIQPQNTTSRVRDAWQRQEDKWKEEAMAAEDYDPEAPPEFRTLTDRERQQIASRVNARHPGEAPDFGPGDRMPLGRGPGFQHPAPPDRDRPENRGGSGRPSGTDLEKRRNSAATPSPRRAMEQLVLSRAQQPVQGQQEGMDFIRNLLQNDSKPSDALQPAQRQQNQTYRDIRSGNSVLNRMAEKGLNEGFSSAAPMQRDLAQSLMSKMDAPPPAMPNYFDRFLDLSQDPGFRLVNFDDL